MTEQDVIDAAMAELDRARTRYPNWPADMIHAAAVASEESGEVVKACNTVYWQQGNETLSDVRKEAIQAIAMWVRFLVDSPAMQEGRQ